jgi:hypothetical protein
MTEKIKYAIPASVGIIAIGIVLIYIGNWWGLSLIILGIFLALIGR